jgi:DNA-binding CsgD family transcriptional regulator
MTDIRQITDWRVPAPHTAVYERLLGTLGTDAFGPAVRDGVASLTAGARRLYLFEATGPGDGALHYFSGEPGLVDVFPAYRKWYLHRDPVCEAYDAAPRSSDLALQRVRPADIESPGFRRRIFDDAGIVERISIVQRGPDAWRVMNVARHASEGCFHDAEIDALVGLACLALPMLPLARAHRPEPLPQRIARLEARFALREPALTLRERQVCARAALGLSVDATAADLDIARTSVLTYRRRAYGRLGVATACELSALVTH